MTINEAHLQIPIIIYLLRAFEYPLIMIHIVMLNDFLFTM